MYTNLLSTNLIQIFYIPLTIWCTNKNMDEEFQVYNSLTKKKEVFRPNIRKNIKWYTCGPTVYDSAHLGHARTFLTFDIIRRILEFFGYSITYVMNITDIDDKIIKRVSEIRDLTPENYNKKFLKFVRDMETEFMDDMDRLGIMRPTVITRVTEYIDKMIKYIEQLEQNGYAYNSNGSVYFDMDAYRKSGFDTEPLKPLSENKTDKTGYSNEKRNPRDFALWKKSKEGEIKYPSKWGLGRIGWHLECSVMATDVLGDNFDIHSGGIDLVFPHHQNEIYQANAHSNNPNSKWVNYFLHSGHLNIQGLKMSKSLKNFITIREYLENVGTSRQLRLLFLMHSWDKPLDYSTDTIEEAKWVDKRIQEFLHHLDFVMRDSAINHIKESDGLFETKLDLLKTNVTMSLTDNFNTQKAVKFILDHITYVYKYLEEAFNESLISQYRNYIRSILDMFGLEFSISSKVEDVEKFIELSVDLREDVRKIVMKYKKVIPKDAMKDFFKILDDFRDVKLKDLGIELQDRSGNKSTKFIYL